MQSTIYFTTDYGKKVSMTLKRDKWGDYTIRFIQINDAIYNAKQISTVKRENTLLEYAWQHIDIDEHFADAQADSFRSNF